MKSNDFITFQKFTDRESAIALEESLGEGGIESILEDVSSSLDLTFAGNTYGHEFLLKVRQSEFGQANAILEAQAAVYISQYPDDYYLFTFSDDELREVVEKMDEWSKEDFLLAKKILNDRGQAISDEKLMEIQKARLAEIRKPEAGKKALIIFGYVAAIVGGVLGLFIGWIYWKSTKIDPTGSRVFIYDQATRREGKTIFLIGVVFSLLILARSIWPD